jgi:hypothetical protein
VFAFRSKVLAASAVTLAIAFLSPLTLFPDASSRVHLLRVYQEVKAIGPKPGDLFVQQEFFAGGPDDDDTNRELHVVVLIQPALGEDKITVQVTRFERDKNDRNIKRAVDTKTVTAEIVKGSVKNLVSEFDELSLHRTLELVQQAVIEKKKLFKDKR